MSIFVLTICVILGVLSLYSNLYTTRFIQRNTANSTAVEGAAADLKINFNNKKYALYVFIWLVIYFPVDSVLEDLEWGEYFDWNEESLLIFVLGMLIIQMYLTVKGMMSLNTSLSNKKILIASMGNGSCVGIMLVVIIYAFFIR